MNLKTILLCIALSIVSMVYSQQTKTVRGKVTDNSKTPLVGVTVLAGTSGTTTDAKGDYLIKVASTIDSLTISGDFYKLTL